jgi:hypothetical protein
MPITAQSPFRPSDHLDVGLLILFLICAIPLLVVCELSDRASRRRSER